MRNPRSTLGKSVRLPGILLLLWVLPGFFFTLQAQFYNGSQMTFGKNRVQYNDFFWTYFRFDQFDTYFYLNGRELAEFTAEYTDLHLREIELMLQSGLETKLQFIIFNNLSDLKQSNIGLYGGEWDNYNTGGVTRIIGGRILLYFDGDYGHFEEQIRSGIATVILNQMMYGAGIGAQIKNNALFNMPDWYMKGLTSYIGSPWNTEIDNLVRDGILSKRFEKFNRLTGVEAIRAGHSLWHYIEVIYGKQAIPNIVYMSRMSRNIEKGFEQVLGLKFETLLSNWLKYYQNRYQPLVAGRSDPTGTILNTRNKPDLIYRQLKVSPDGSQVAYVTHRLGVYKVFVKDILTGRKKRIFRGGYRLAEHVDYTFPVITWHPTGRILAILTEQKGESVFYFYDLETRHKRKQIIYDFQKIRDISYSNAGYHLAMSAVMKGQSDIFTYDILANSYERLTDDLYDDFSPRFLPGDAEIIFSSNRKSDTLRFYERVDISTLQFNNDIFILNRQTHSPILKRITHTPLVDEIQPMPYSDGYLCFLSNANGIYNRFLARFDSVVSFVDTTTHYRYITHAFPVTNYKQSILEQDGSLPAATLGEIIRDNRNNRMILQEMIRPQYATRESLVSSEFMTREVEQTALKKAIARGDTTLPEAAKPVVKEQSHFKTVMLGDAIREQLDPEKGDSITLQRLLDNYELSLVTVPDTISPGEADEPGGEHPGHDEPGKVPGNEGDPKTIRVVDRQMVAAGEAQPAVQYLEPMKEDSTNKYTGAPALNYNVEYSIDEMVTQIDFTYMNMSYQPFGGSASPVFINPGLNVLFMMGVTDLMEDYRITGGVRLNFDLVNNEYLFSYTNNKKRLDHQIIYHRLGVDDFGYYSYIRHKVNELYYVLTYPLNPVLRVRGTASIRYDRAVYLSTDQVNLQRPDENLVWGSIKGEWTYDNTRSLGLNLYVGTRYKVFGEYYQMINEAGHNVVILGFDFRNYQRIHRSMIWANRIAASTSFGSNKLIYYMGGVDNWLWPRFDLNTPIAFDQNYVFQTLATNMRGFDQNIRNGNSFFVINSEIRMPFFRYIFNRPIRSDIINNFQIVAFGDLGTAWTGSNPWSEENHLFTRYIYRNPLFIQVEMIKDPLVAGFGGGLRTRLLGYFIRADLAWGVEDGRVRRDPVFYFSLSLDF